MGITVEAEVPADDDLLTAFDNAALFVFGLPVSGYAGVFPKSDHLSVGIGAFLGRSENLRQLLEQEMARPGVPLAQARLYGHPLPVYLRAEAVLREDVHGYTARIHREIGNDLLWGLHWARQALSPRLNGENAAWIPVRGRMWGKAVNQRQ